ncbi:MAG: DUF3943 domain-containing protein [Muribaculaceae bacterium]
MNTFRNIITTVLIIFYTSSILASGNHIYQHPDSIIDAPYLVSTDYINDTTTVSDNLCLHDEDFKPYSIFDMPYSRKAEYRNPHRLLVNTAVLFGAGVVTLGVLELLPEDATAWNKEELRQTPVFERWWNHVKKGPVWDKDNMIFNYVLHPYGGAAYYMSARGQGYNTFHSALYSAAISTFFWEYGIEAFMEIPSIQDLIITPIAGSIIGEGFYILKRRILENDYRFIGSKALGKVVVFLIDPVNSFVDLFRGSSCKRHVAYTPWMNNGIGFSLSATF